MTDRPDLAALRALAEAAQHWEVGLVLDAGEALRYKHDWEAFRHACSPERILALIAEVEDRRGTVERIRAALDSEAFRAGLVSAVMPLLDRISAILDREEARHAR